MTPVLGIPGLVDTIARKARMPKSHAERVVWAIREVMAEQLRAGESVRFAGWGTFSLRHRPARQERNPFAGTPVDVPAKNYVKFVPGPQLRRDLNSLEVKEHGGVPVASGEHGRDTRTTRKEQRMSVMSTIAWTSCTWNPIVGCRRVSSGCEKCYAIQESHRMAGHPNEKIAHANAGLTVRHANGHLDWTGHVRVLPDRLTHPLHWKRPRRIFVNSLSDFFHEDVPISFIDEMLCVMEACPHHVFQVLTKRPEQMQAKLYGRTPEHPMRLLTDGVCLPNVWWGVSCETQAMADERVPRLLQIPAAVHWVSAEPLLEAMDLTNYVTPHTSSDGDGGGYREARRIGWVVCGGESARDARRCDPVWLVNLLLQCKRAGVPCFMKQLGSRPVGLVVQDMKGGRMDEWPEVLRVREYPP